MTALTSRRHTNEKAKKGFAKTFPLQHHPSRSSPAYLCYVLLRGARQWASSISCLVTYHSRLPLLAHGCARPCPTLDFCHPGLSLNWVNVFIERSRTLLMDFNFLADPRAGSDTFYVKIIQLLQVFMRIRSLCLTRNISIMGSLFYSSPIQSLSIRIDNEAGKLILPNYLFGGKAPIRRVQFIGGCRIDAT